MKRSVTAGQTLTVTNMENIVNHEQTNDQPGRGLDRKSLDKLLNVALNAFESSTKIPEDFLQLVFAEYDLVAESGDAASTIDLERFGLACQHVGKLTHQARYTHQ
jgi:hypothetical protein